MIMDWKRIRLLSFNIFLLSSLISLSEIFRSRSGEISILVSTFGFFVLILSLYKKHHKSTKHFLIRYAFGESLLVSIAFIIFALTINIIKSLAGFDVYITLELIPACILFFFLTIGIIVYTRKKYHIQTDADFATYLVMGCIFGVGGEAFSLIFLLLAIISLKPSEHFFMKLFTIKHRSDYEKLNIPIFLQSFAVFAMINLNILYSSFKGEYFFFENYQIISGLYPFLSLIFFVMILMYKNENTFLFKVALIPFFVSTIISIGMNDPGNYPLYKSLFDSLIGNNDFSAAELIIIEGLIFIPSFQIFISGFPYFFKKLKNGFSILELSPIDFFFVLFIEIMAFSSLILYFPSLRRMWVFIALMIILLSAIIIKLMNFHHEYAGKMISNKININDSDHEKNIKHYSTIWALLYVVLIILIMILIFLDFFNNNRVETINISIILGFFLFLSEKIHIESKIRKYLNEI